MNNTTAVKIAVASGIGIAVNSAILVKRFKENTRYTNTCKQLGLTPQFESPMARLFKKYV